MFGIKIFVSEMEEVSHSLNVGTVMSDGKTFLKVACTNGYIYIKELQMAGKKRMLVEEFLRGFKIDSDFKSETKLSFVFITFPSSGF